MSVVEVKSKDGKFESDTIRDQKIECARPWLLTHEGGPYKTGDGYKTWVPTVYCR